jgi:hypothetical protein
VAIIQPMSVVTLFLCCLRHLFYRHASPVEIFLGDRRVPHDVSLGVWNDFVEPNATMVGVIQHDRGERELERRTHAVAFLASVADVLTTVRIENAHSEAPA